MNRTDTIRLASGEFSLTTCRRGRFLIWEHRCSVRFRFRPRGGASSIERSVGRRFRPRGGASSIERSVGRRFRFWGSVRSIGATNGGRFKRGDRDILHGPCCPVPLTVPVYPLRGKPSVQAWLSVLQHTHSPQNSLLKLRHFCTTGRLAFGVPQWNPDGAAEAAVPPRRSSAATTPRRLHLTLRFEVSHPAAAVVIPGWFQHDWNLIQSTPRFRSHLPRR